MVDPGWTGQRRWLWGLADEPLGMRGVDAVQGLLAGGPDLLGAAVVHVGWGQQPDPGVAVGVVVVGEERAGERPGVMWAQGTSGEYFNVLSPASE